jgi:multisubunit Na+/H+ antiporter MnhC subunit
MRPLLRTAALLLLVAGLACSDDDATAPTPTLLLVENGEFETGDLTGWMKSVTTNFTADVYVGNDATGPASGFAIPAPAAGSNHALFDQGGPATHILYQDITIPAGYTQADFTASIYLNNTNSDYAIAPTEGLTVEGAEENQQFRIDVMSTTALDDVGAGVLQNLYQTDPGDPLTETLIVTANLAAFAGQTVRLRFAAAVNEDYFQIGIDEVQVVAD